MDQKPYKTIDEQVEILKDRGLIISDEDYAKRCLTQLNYYRLSGYTLTLRKNNSFYKNITFSVLNGIHVSPESLDRINEKIKELYVFTNK